jgi:hypothetical protein
MHCDAARTRRADPAAALQKQRRAGPDVSRRRPARRARCRRVPTHRLTTVGVVRPVVTSVTPVIAIASIVDAVIFGGVTPAEGVATPRPCPLQRGRDCGGDRDAE